MEISSKRVYRGVSFGSFLIAAMLMVSAASAQEKPSYYEELDSATSNCFSRCEVDTSHQAAAAAPAKKAAVKSASPAASATKRVRQGGARATATASARIDMGVFRKLEKRVGVLEDRADGHDDDIASIREELENLRGAMASASASATVTGDGDDNDHEAIQGLVDVQQRQNALVIDAMRKLNERLVKIEESRKAPFGNSVGLTAGLFLLGGSDGFSFTSPYIGVRLNIGLNDEFFLYVEPSLMVAPGNRPFSAGLAGGVGYKLFGDGNLGGALRFGVKQAAMAIRSDLDARAIATLGDVGFDVRISKHFRVGGDIFLGPYFMPERAPGIATGGDAHIGFDF